MDNKETIYGSIKKIRALMNTYCRIGFSIVFVICFVQYALSQLLLVSDYLSLVQTWFTIMVFILLSIVLINIILKAKWDEFNRDKIFKEKIIQIEQLFKEEKYEEVLEVIKNEEAFRLPYKLKEHQRLLLFVKYKVDSLIQTGRTQEAVIKLAGEICSIYNFKEYPEELLQKWFDLYGSCKPIDVKAFYFCPCCGLHPSTIRLFDLTIEKGYEPPKGYLNYSPGSSIIIDKNGVYTLKS